MITFIKENWVELLEEYIVKPIICGLLIVPILIYIAIMAIAVYIFKMEVPQKSR